MYRFAVVSALACSLFTLCASGQSLILAENGASEYTIVLAENASPSEKTAAEDLQFHLKEMTGVELPIIGDTLSLPHHAILLGDNPHLKSLGITIPFDALGDEGFVIRTVGPHLVIAGGRLRGTMYGVYELLEMHLGCRWFTPDVSHVPKLSRLEIAPLNVSHVPQLQYRWPAVRDCYDAQWCARNRVNVSPKLTAEHGGSVTFCGWAHTFGELVPVARYFDAHPEYFSLVDGERINERTQLCCTNEEVIQIVIEGIRKRMREHPDATYFSVSQNDWGNYCECDACQALAEQEESQMGPVLQLVNRVAETVADEFSDKRITTLAYQWSRKPPKTIRPMPNVTIRLCSIECCFAHGLATCDMEANVRFREDVKGWAAICDNLWVWNYTTNFRNYYLPHPVLRPLDDDIRFYLAHNVRGIYEQDTKLTLNGEFSHLGAYLMAKYLWNPDYDEDVAMNEFLDAVYGAAATHIRAYIDLVHDKVRDDNIHVRCYGGADAAFLSEDVLSRARKLFDQAESAVALDPEALQRVRFCRLPIDFATVERAHLQGSPALAVNHETFTVTADPLVGACAQRFLTVGKEAGMMSLSERKHTLEEYQREIQGFLSQTLTPCPAVNTVNPFPGLRYEYYEADSWEKDGFTHLEPVKTGAVALPDLSPRARDQMFGFRFSGLVEAPRDGIYTFHLRAEAGSWLSVCGQTLVAPSSSNARDGRSGMIALRKGLHPIEVGFREYGFNDGLDVRWQGPGFDMQPIPAEAFFCETE